MAKKSSKSAAARSPKKGNLPATYSEMQPTVDGKAKMDGSWINASDNDYYNTPYYKAHAKAAQTFPNTRGSGIINLASYLPANSIDQIKHSQQVSFHAVGDTGATLQSKLANEEAVSDMMADDVKQKGVSFFFHLGDLVYEFGEENYYYEQFYSPFQNYSAPIFAIPGNHDGMVYNQTMKSLDAFLKNFCASKAGTAINAAGLSRNTMDQPGVYFRLDAPFVSIIGLYTNVIDAGPGVISTQGGKFPTVGTAQYAFLKTQLTDLKKLKKTDPRAVIVALHHPPFAGDARHGGSPIMSSDLDAAFNGAGLWPDLILSGHTHHYERFERLVNGTAIPYVIAGSGGYNMKPMKNAPSSFPFSIPGRTDLKLTNYQAAYGYLTVTVNAVHKSITISFNTPSEKGSPRKYGVDTKSYQWS